MGLIRPEIKNIMLRGRFNKKSCIWKSFWASLNWCGGLWEDFGCVWAGGWCTELTNSVLLWGGWVGVLSFRNKKNKKCLRSLDTHFLSALGCLFRADFPCKHAGRRTRSCLANPSGQTGPSWVSPAFIPPPSAFRISYRRLPIPVCIFSLMCNLTETVESDSSAARRVKVEHQGSVPRSHKARWCHTLAPVVRILDRGQDSGCGANSSKGREPKE